MTNSSSFNLTYSDDLIAILSIDVKGESQNVLKESFIGDFNDLLDEIEQSDALGVILTSAKPDTFIAGADINMLKAMQDRESIAKIADAGYATFKRLENFKIPVVAEINGACLGGGLEMSLACHGRVASDDKATKFALPEVQIGLLPGGGGTQRLPELIGVVEALGMMTTGMHIPAQKAYRMGLVDRLSNKTYLRQASKDLLSALRQNKIKRNELTSSDWKNPTKLINHVLNRQLIKTKPVRDFILDKARAKVLAKTKGKYPAPLKIIDCVEAWGRDGMPLGFETEARLFADLVLSPEAKQLMNLFFAITDLKKERFISGRTKPKTIERLGVVGGGLMGSGIALVTAEKANTPVRVQEMSRKALDNCMNYAYMHLQKKLKRRRIKPAAAKQVQQRITGTTDYSGFANCDLVVEAAFESLEVKHEVIKNIEKNSPKGVIIATNTSSIPITEIASAAKKPENVIGMHYFSPVEKMPLLEIIKTEQTSDKAITTAVEFGRKQGKTVIVVSDGAGFYTSRILAAYMNEAARVLSMGVPVEDIDRAMVEFGFPVG
ncbi:MAG: fatty acid oxidation complex subunit alpha FadJ, partial [Enterobacterales bacterium]|nr:fatty acid oxidation complex subunit alpha FadJ [Enterobacterales bacterium]